MASAHPKPEHVIQETKVGTTRKSQLLAVLRVCMLVVLGRCPETAFLGVPQLYPRELITAIRGRLPHVETERHSRAPRRYWPYRVARACKVCRRAGLTVRQGWVVPSRRPRHCGPSRRPRYGHARGGLVGELDGPPKGSFGGVASLPTEGRPRYVVLYCRGRATLPGASGRFCVPSDDPSTLGLQAYRYLG